jgi:hypothetical protein
MFGEIYIQAKLREFQELDSPRRAKVMEEVLAASRGGIMRGADRPPGRIRNSLSHESERRCRDA